MCIRDRVIHDYTREAGVRQLERELAALSRKATRRIVGDGHAGNTLVMAPESLKDYLGAAKFVNETAETIKEVGIATGLAWTPVDVYKRQPYLSAKFEVVQDLKEDSVELTAMMRNAQTQFQEIIKLSPALSEQIKIAALNTEDPGHFTDLVAVNLNLNLEERQKLLETNSVKERLTRLLPMLNREMCIRDRCSCPVTAHCGRGRFLYFS